MSSQRAVRRAAPLPPDERRRAIVEAVVPLLVEHGRAVTTRQIAERAGIAEGTIFRVFDNKDALVDAALDAAFDPRPFLADLAQLVGARPAPPLRDRLVALTTVLQRRYTGIFSLMRSLGLVAPPERHDPAPVDAEVDAGADAEGGSWLVHARRQMLALVEPDADLLRVPPERVLHLLRLLTFSGSHPDIADHDLLTPDEIVTVLLDGVLARPGCPDRPDPHPRKD